MYLPVSPPPPPSLSLSLSLSLSPSILLFPSLELDGVCFFLPQCAPRSEAAPLSYLREIYSAS
jgi:hypothetical protein